MQGPAYRYYEACAGRWRAPLGFTITDLAALRRSGLSTLDRLALRALAAWPSWLPPVWLETAVIVRDAQTVVHETSFRWLGLPLKRSVEVYLLGADGRSLQVTGDMTGDGEVDETATKARYRLRWLGVDVRQETLREDAGVVIQQEGEGFSGTQVLSRRG